MHMLKYHTVANDVHGYYVSVKMNCHIKSNVKGDEKRGMLNGIKVVMEEGTEVIRNSLGSTVCGGRGYNGMAERGSYTSRKRRVGIHILGMEERKWWKQPSNAEE